MVVHTDKDSVRNNGECWHSDVSADEEPPMGSMLHIHQVSSRGGDTCWSSMYAAYNALSPAMQALLDPLTALHVADYAGHYGEHKPQRESPRAVHPVVRTHPVTKKKALFVNEVFTRRINELAAPESRAVLAFLFDHVKDINFQCRFPMGGPLHRALGQPLHPSTWQSGTTSPRREAASASPSKGTGRSTEWCSIGAATMHTRSRGQLTAGGTSGRAPPAAAGQRPRAGDRLR